MIIFSWYFSSNINSLFDIHIALKILIVFSSDAPGWTSVYKATCFLSVGRAPLIIYLYKAYNAKVLQGQEPQGQLMV